MSPYISILFLFLFIIFLVGSIVVISHILGARRLTYAKGLPYECGIDPAPYSRGPFSVKFYVVAIVFLLFDVETALLYPWAAVYNDLRNMGLHRFAAVEAFVFVGLLAIGLLYVWRRGALNWEK